MTRPRVAAQHGAAGVACIVMLVILQLLVVGSVVSDTREQDTTVQRLNSVRAFYAAEGGMNMAVREFMGAGGAGIDYDGDGAVGSISNDNDDFDNPALGIARVVVSRNSFSNQASGVTSDAIAEGCRSRIVATVAVDSIAGRRVIYGQWSNTFPLYRIWTGSEWGPPRNTIDLGAKIYWAAIRRCPTRTEVAVVCSLQSGKLMALVQQGLTWGNVIELAPDCGSTTSRPFSFAYEQSSGEGLAVYRRLNQSKVYYRTWDGTAWSSEYSVTNVALNGKPLFMKLVPRPNSNEMMLYALDDQNAIVAMVWNGSSFVNEVTLETNYATVAVNVENEVVDAAYETTSGRCMLVWGRNLGLQPRYRIWDGSAWQAEAAMPALPNQAIWSHLAADRASNKLMCGMLDLSGNITVNVWNGSSWGSNLMLETTAPTLGSRCFDVAFEPAGTRGMVMWGRGVFNQARYRIYNGSSWSSELTAPATYAVPYLVQLTPSRNGSEIMIAHNLWGGQNLLQFMRWDGSSMVNLQELEPNLSGPIGAEVFMIPDDPQGIIDPMRVRSWAPAAP